MNVHNDFFKGQSFYVGPTNPLAKEEKENRMDELDFLRNRCPELERENLQISQEMTYPCETEKKINSVYTSSQDMHLIIEGIYLGNINAYKNWVKNAEDNPKNHSMIISAIKMNAYPPPPPNIQHLILNIDDDQSAWTVKDGMKDQLKNIFQLIDRARIEKKRLLIHCMAGRSRSALILTAYLMWSCQQEYQVVLPFIRSRRLWVDLSKELADILNKEFQEMLNRVGRSACH